MSHSSLWKGLQIVSHLVPMGHNLAGDLDAPMAATKPDCPRAGNADANTVTAGATSAGRHAGQT